MTAVDREQPGRTNGRWVMESGFNWRYWYKRRINGRGDVAYGVYRELPQTIPPQLEGTFGSEEEAQDYILDLFSDAPGTPAGLL